jgi:hypothetical protein
MFTLEKSYLWMSAFVIDVAFGAWVIYAFVLIDCNFSSVRRIKSQICLLFLQCRVGPPLWLARPQRSLFRLSDDCSHLLANDSGPRRPRSFKFENFWASIPGFNDTVFQTWGEPLGHHEAFQNLFYKIKHMAKCLKRWSRGLFSKIVIYPRRSVALGIV